MLCAPSAIQIAPCMPTVYIVVSLFFLFVATTLLDGSKSLAGLVYGLTDDAGVDERHRHRYEINPEKVCIKQFVRSDSRSLD
jgi:hypothetical protein